MRFLLKNVSGEAKPGRLLAIMGASGSGKTTLLNVMAGQLTASPRLHLSGLLEINGKPRSNKSFKYVFSWKHVSHCGTGTRDQFIRFSYVSWYLLIVISSFAGLLTSDRRIFSSHS